ncbi:MAG: hypothetical protein AB4038_11365 [Prochloraceae cyanobacterium]
MTIPVPQRNNNKLIEGFYPLQKEELMALREVKLINNAAYVHLALRYENPFCDRPVQIAPKEFALRWRIPESSVYKAYALLKDLGVLNIKSGKLVIDWIIKPDNEASKPEPETVTEIIPEPVYEARADELSDPAKNSQIREKIIRSDNSFSDLAKNSQIRENRGLKPLSDIGSEISQTIQTFQTNQTRGGEDEAFFQEAEQPEDSVVQEQVQQSKEDLKEEKKLVSLTETSRQVSRNVVQKKPKIISPSKKRCDPASAQDALGSAPRQFNTSGKQASDEIPEDLKEKLLELEITLDNKVRKAIASHDISQAYGAAAHVENTWSTITNPRSVFLYQLPKQPIEKLGSRYSEEIINNIKAQNRAIEEERKDPEYQKRSSEFFTQIRATLNKKKSKKKSKSKEEQPKDFSVLLFPDNSTTPLLQGEYSTKEAAEKSINKWLSLEPEGKGEIYSQQQ